MHGEIGAGRFIREAVCRLDQAAPPPSSEALAAELGLPVERILRLDQNENPYGASIRVQEALAAFDRYHLYPDPEGRGVRELLAGYAGMPAERIVLGNGIDDLLDRVCLLTLDPGDEVIVATPTVERHRARAALHGGRVLAVPRRPDFGLDIDATVRAVSVRTKAIVLMSPNDPTGNVIAPDHLIRLLRLGPFVVLDESYAEFAQRPLLPLAREFDNLIVFRSLDTWAGLAGLGIAYGIVPGALLPYLRRVRGAQLPNAASLVAVEATFEELAWVRSASVRIRVERDRLFRQLRKLNLLQPLPSQGNFFLCRVVRGDAATLRARLADLGIIVRGFDGALADYLRIGVGRPEDTDTLMKALVAIAERM